MAGTWHHILPRFLLKGFASKVVREDVFTWVYRKGKVFESNIVNVAVGKHFYGEGEEANVDDGITAIESEFAILLDRLRQKEDHYEITDPSIADFVGHLSSRTKHLRDSFIEASGVLLTIITGYFADEHNFRSWILDYYKRHPEIVRKALEDALDKIPVDETSKAVLASTYDGDASP